MHGRPARVVRLCARRAARLPCIGQMRRTTATIALLAIAVAAVCLTGCASEPDTVLQSDLPQIPGMVPRDTTGLRQSEGRVTAGQFSYKGPISNLNARADETMSRFDQAGWKLVSQTLSAATASFTYRKDNRTVRVEIIQNGVQPKMSTAVLTVTSEAAVKTAEPASVAPPTGAVPAPVSG